MVNSWVPHKYNNDKTKFLIRIGVALAVILFGILAFAQDIHSEQNYQESKALPPPPSPFDLLTEKSSAKEIKLAVVFLADSYGEDWINYKVLNNTLDCESDYDNSQIGLAGEIGIAQFMPSTWKKWTKRRGIKADIHDIKDQLEMFVWAFHSGLAWNWTCYKNPTKV